LTLEQFKVINRQGSFPKIKTLGTPSSSAEGARIEALKVPRGWGVGGPSPPAEGHTVPSPEKKFSI